MRLLVCGSRTFEDAEVLYQVLDAMTTVERQWEIGTTIIHGAARGADSLAQAYAEHMFVPVERYPADWDRYGKRAGYVRNQQMLVDGKPDLVVAFVDKPLAESKGTNMMVTLARDAGIKTIVVEVQ